VSEHRIELEWVRGEGGFDREGFSREHAIHFAGGQRLRGSSAPDYFGDAALANPEELLVAALSSCHMLTFLAVAAKRGWIIERYHDAATGVLEKNTAGKFAVTQVTLAPEVAFGGDRAPDPDELAALHHRAHQHCMIANSVTTEVRIVPR
jgi:organic hydroperoxide reductase OsmC/OhrA